MKKSTLRRLQAQTTNEATATAEAVSIDDLDPVTAEAVAWMLNAA